MQRVLLIGIMRGQVFEVHDQRPLVARIDDGSRRSEFRLTKIRVLDLLNTGQASKSTLEFRNTHRIGFSLEPKIDRVNEHAPSISGNAGS